MPADAPGAVPQYAPVAFIRHERVAAADRLLLGFGASVLARVQGATPAVGVVVHGRQFRVSRVKLERRSVRAVPPSKRSGRSGGGGLARPLLNRHCPECEFRKRCRAAAVEKDDLSLISGLSPKEIAQQNKKGIFTVTQYSYTFRPGRLQKGRRAKGKVMTTRSRPWPFGKGPSTSPKRQQVPAGKVAVFLDVEGLPTRTATT